MTHARRVGRWLPAIAALLAAAIIGSHQPPANAQAEAAVTIQGFAFAPSSVTVRAGATVRWTHRDSAPHTVTSGAPGAASIGGLFRSPPINSGGTFSFTFNEAGTYAYFCEIHPRMVGSVTVEAATSPPATTTTAPPALPSAPAEPAQALVIARDYAFSAPPVLPQGINKITLMNIGQEPHHAQIMRLNDGVGLEQFGAAAREGPQAIFPLVSFRGGPGTVDNGGTQDVWVDLPAGTYLFFCFVESPDGVSHAAKGMVQPFQVSEEASATAAPAGASDAEMGDFYFVLPEMQAGSQAIKLVNVGAQVHELALIKMTPGAGLAELIAFFTAPAGPPPFSSAGGFQAVDTGLSGWAQLNLSSGSYLAICNVPDPASGKPHYELGMVAAFEIP